MESRPKLQSENGDKDLSQKDEPGAESYLKPLEKNETPTESVEPKDYSKLIGRRDTTSSRHSFSKTDLPFAAGCITKLYVPITACAVLVLVETRLTYDEKMANENQKQLGKVFGPFGGSETDDIDKTWRTFMVVGGFLALLVCTTWILITAYYFRCYASIRVSLMFVTFFIFSFVAPAKLLSLLEVLRLPMDWITMALLVWNLAVVGVGVVHCTGPVCLRRSYLVVLAVLVTGTIVQTFNEVTTWVILVALAFWDLFAVLAPCGPLRIMVETARERGESLFPSLIYATGGMTMALLCNVKEAKSGNGPTKGDVEDDEGVKLGLGDFIFYSLLLVRSMLAEDWLALLSTYVAVLLGLTVTLLALMIHRQALPALPISIVLGTWTHFSVIYFVSPFCDELQRRQLFV